jgi:hypothetical protein
MRLRDGVIARSVMARSFWKTSAITNQQTILWRHIATFEQWKSRAWTAWWWMGGVLCWCNWTPVVSGTGTSRERSSRRIAAVGAVGSAAPSTPYLPASWRRKHGWRQRGLRVAYGRGLTDPWWNAFGTTAGMLHFCGCLWLAPVAVLCSANAVTWRKWPAGLFLMLLPTWRKLQCVKKRKTEGLQYEKMFCVKKKACGEKNIWRNRRLQMQWRS